MAAEEFQSAQPQERSELPRDGLNNGADHEARSEPRRRAARSSGQQSDSSSLKSSITRVSTKARETLNSVDDRQIVQALGWFSIGLGLVEVFAPRKLGRAIGVGSYSSALPLLGVREIVTGIGLLSGGQPSKWTRGRVAGDAMDLAVLASATRATNARPGRVVLAAAAVAGVTAIDIYASRKLGNTAPQREAPVSLQVHETLAINATPAAVYAFWRNLENLSLFMDHVKSVSSTDKTKSHWVVRAPAGTTIEWEAEITRDEPDRLLSWRTLEDSQVQHEGTVEFEPAIAGRGTLVKVSLNYQPPAGTLGAQVAKLFGEEPRQQIRSDLRKLKQLIETGEVATTQGQPSGKRSLLGRATLGRLWS